MRTLAELLRSAPGLEPDDAEWLRLLVEDWQLIADLGFCDLVLWVQGERGWVAAAHTRPMTGPMAFVEDVVEHTAWSEVADLLDEAVAGEEPVGAADEWGSGRVVAVPVRRRGRILGVLSRHAPDPGGRVSSRLEEAYHSLADDLSAMVAAGEWPVVGSPTGQRRGAPRVGDGVVRLGAEGQVRYASPNALSALRRLGHQGPLQDAVLAQVLGSLPELDGPLDEGLALVAMGRAAWRAEVGTTSGAAVSLRAIPLLHRGHRTGALVLLRDVSDLRYRESELLSKDQTIREIHHRVKNNLQTVAALLRMQSRRLDDGPGREALDEAVRRVAVIALVYETLSTGFSEEVNFDEIAVRGLRAIVEVARTDALLDSRVEGSFGWMGPQDATAVALIVSELVQNAVEHGLRGSGCVVVRAERRLEDGEEILRVSIEDDGSGLPAGFRPSRAGLGTRIVTSMVQDLKGTIRWDDVEPTGTKVSFSARLGRRS